MATVLFLVIVRYQNSGNMIINYVSVTRFLKVSSTIRVNLQKFSQLIQGLRDDLMKASTAHLMYLFHAISGT